MPEPWARKERKRERKGPKRDQYERATGLSLPVLFALSLLSRFRVKKIGKPRFHTCSNGRKPRTISPRWFSFFASAACCSAAARFSAVVALTVTKSLGRRYRLMNTA